MKRKSAIKLILILLVITTLASVLSVSAFAATNVTGVTPGDVAGAVEKTWSDAKTQIKKVVDNVVFPILDMILAVLFFVKVASSYFDYRKHGQFDFAPPAILFACLLFSLTCPLYIWNII